VHTVEETMPPWTEMHVPTVTQHTGYAPTVCIDGEMIGEAALGRPTPRPAGSPLHMPPSCA